MLGVLSGTRQPPDRRTTSSTQPSRETGSGPIVARIRHVTGGGGNVIDSMHTPIEVLHQNASAVFLFFLYSIAARSLKSLC